MKDIMLSFEDWFLHLDGDIDESLLESKSECGEQYVNEYVDMMWTSFRAGYAAGK